ncbi:hypothetical protein CBS101457_004575 [Exobasidium rhododendri]|nr:hypothetical protein CBS101457_004575 [Exobasidium rhododendri]
MKPVATLFHWDLPLQLEIRYGGFSDESVVDDFARYASIVFEALGRKGVKTFFTFNEPQEFCLHRYPLVRPHVHGQTISDPSLPWQCAGHLLKAHGKAVEIFRGLKVKQVVSSKAKISYKNAGSYSVPYRKHDKLDSEAVKRSTAFYLDLFARPIHKTGDYPPLVKEEVPAEWLPDLTKEDKERIKGSADFFSTDFYSTSVAKSTSQQGGFNECIGNLKHPAWPTCSDYSATTPEGQLLGEKSDALTESWLMNTAGTLRRHLKYVYDEYKPDSIVITEFGWSERDQDGKTDLADVRNDDGRQRYFRDHLAEMLLAVYKDGTPLTGCFIWAATDNVEWEYGTAPRFGVQSIDYHDPELPRTFLNSFFYIRSFFKKHL